MIDLNKLSKQAYEVAYWSKRLAIEIVDGKNTDLHIDKPVYTIYLVAVKEV